MSSIAPSWNQGTPVRTVDRHIWRQAHCFRVQLDSTIQLEALESIIALKFELVGTRDMLGG